MSIPLLVKPVNKDLSTDCECGNTMPILNRICEDCVDAEFFYWDLNQPEWKTVPYEKEV